MNFSTRTLGPVLLLLLLFLGASATLQWWSVRESGKLQTLAIAEQQQRLEGILTLLPDSTSPAAAADWLRQAGHLVGGDVTLQREGSADALLPAEDHLVFVQALPTLPGWQARVEFTPPALLRLQRLHQHTLTVMVFLALIVLSTPLLLVLINNRARSPADGQTRTPWATVKAQAVGMEQLAKISHERTTALAQEHGARVRAEENLEINRSLLDQSMADRVRLGRELHDNICQTLYAVCLTLGSVQKKNTLAPELAARVDQCLTELKRLNREVRAYLQDLEPARLHEQTFSSAVDNMARNFTAEESVEFDLRLDEEALALIPSQQTADILNIVREAVSNGIRHGHARRITLRTAHSDGAIAISIQDNGSGFALPTTHHASGHGLGNMRARANELGGELKVDSAPGNGTRILLTLPVPSLA